jgi:thiosulfate dehydrogenase [quinone] large subunit
MMAVVRIALGVMWVANVSWKTPPDFGEGDRAGLYQFTAYAVEYPVLGAWSWIVEEVVLANFTLFGWMTLVVEAALGALLLLGLGTRLGALAGILMSIAIGLSVA